jgi:hypothetical protein
MDTKRPRFAGLRLAPIAVHRKVFFAQSHQTLFFMAVKGKPEHVFNPDAPPDIVATQGTVEEWVVQNRASQNHVFHIHQLHFLVESQNNFELNGSQQAPAITGQYLDMIQVPFWDFTAMGADPRPAKRGFLVELLTGASCGASVTALAPSTVYELAKRDLAPVLDARPQIAQELSRALAQQQNAGRALAAVERDRSPSGK